MSKWKRKKNIEFREWQTLLCAEGSFFFFFFSVNGFGLSDLRERALQSLSIYYRSQYRCAFGFLSLCCYVAWKWHSFNKTNEELVVVVVTGSTGMPLGGICIYENYWCLAPLGRTSRDWMPECGFRWLWWRFRVGCCNKKAPAGITLWRYTVICFLAAECWPKHKMSHKRITTMCHYG